MRATIVLMAMLATGSAFAQDETVAISSSPVTSTEAPADAAACPCAEASTIDLGAAPEPESVVTIAPASAAAPLTGFGSGARGWVELQTGGSAASVTARPLPGDAATNAYERYANSFKHPIPESFKRESFSADGGE